MVDEAVRRGTALSDDAVVAYANAAIDDVLACEVRDVPTAPR